MTTHLSRIKYDVIVEPLAGQLVSGDDYFIKEYDDFILFAVVDGLGHGEDAAIAAKKAIQTLDSNAHEPLENLIALCDQALLDTRGAAMTLGKIDYRNILSYVAAGNVAGVCWKRDGHARLIHESFHLDNGIVGSRLSKKILVKKIALSVGDMIILATDGIRSTFGIHTPLLEPLEKMSKRIFDNYRNKNDDGLVLIMQLLS